ncbi:MAG: arsenate reductase ArsC [Pseudomonadota bacterium]
MRSSKHVCLSDERVPEGILFLCVANSARSQMAEGIARTLAPSGTRIDSAGSWPTVVHPLAVQVLAEIGIDISEAVSTDVDTIDEDSVDLVITLCEEEVCPVWLASAWILRWPLPDPAAAPEKVRLQAFRTVRDEIMLQLRRFFSGEPGEGE